MKNDDPAIHRIPLPDEVKRRRLTPVISRRTHENGVLATCGTCHMVYHSTPGQYICIIVAQPDALPSSWKHCTACSMSWSCSPACASHITNGCIGHYHAPSKRLSSGGGSFPNLLHILPSIWLRRAIIDIDPFAPLCNICCDMVTHHLINTTIY